MRYGKFVILGLIALVAFKVAFSLMDERGSEEQKGNGLIIEPGIINVGTVIKDKGITFSTSMRNNGQKPIKIAKIEHSCHCIEAYPAKDTCQPGETVSVSGTLVPNKIGRFRHVVKLIEEDASAPEHRIEVVGIGKAEGGGTVLQSGSSNP